MEEQRNAVRKMQDYIQDQDRYLREMYLTGTEKSDLGTRFLENNPHVDTL